jgi:hypothetical protein
VGLAFGLDLPAAIIIAAALGFSSTVLAAKTLESRSELEAYHGRIAIGILILQDIVAIILLAFSGLGAPSPWALLLLALPLSRPILLRLLAASKHDELLLLFGLLLALGGGGLFELVGLSSELGAVTAGALLAGHPQADELADKLWGLKEAFLVAFFLEIGLAGVPSVGGVLIAFGLLLFLPIRTFLYFIMMVALRLRARTGFMVGVSLTSYSEFALIAGAPAASAGLIPESALLILAMAVVLSFVIGAPLNRVVHRLYARLEPTLLRYERDTKHPDETPQVLGGARSLVFGMGRTGTAAYDFLKEQQHRPVGLDSDPGKLEQHHENGRRVVYGDAEDPELWENLKLERLETVILAVPDFEARMSAVVGLRGRGFNGTISAISMFPEEEGFLKEAGADLVAHPLAEAGFGLAQQSVKPQTV